VGAGPAPGALAARAAGLPALSLGALALMVLAFLATLYYLGLAVGDGRCRHPLESPR